LTVRTEYVEAEYGRATGAQLSVVTRAGTNEFHGSLFGYFGNDKLDANDWFANNRGDVRQPRRFSDYGGTLGGPFKRDRTFFFASYEGQRQSRPAFAITEVPSLSARREAPTNLRQFMSAFPQPTGAARADGFAEFAAGFSTPARLDSFTFRLDQSVSNNLKLNARYALSSSAADGRGVDGSSLNTVGRDHDLTQTLTGGADYVISPSAVTSVRANYSRVAARGSRLLDSFGGAVVPGADATNDGGLLSPLNSSFTFDLGGRGAMLGSSAPAVNIQHQLNVVGSLDFVSGAHSYKFGVDYRRLTPFIGPPARERDVYFAGVADALNGTASRDGSFTRASARPVFDNFSAYAQDEWRRTPRLTLTYGLRWELSPAPHSNEGTNLAAVTQVEDPSRLSFKAPGAQLWGTTFFNFAPRFGLAYQLSDGSGRELVLRAGMALFYDTGDAEAGYAFSDSHPFTDGGAAFGVPFDASAAPPAPGAALGAPISAFDPHLKLPYTLRWHATVERALGRSQSVSATYVGAAGRRLLLTRTLLDPSPDFSLVRLTTNGARPDYNAAQFEFRRRASRGFEAVVSYTWAKSLDDFSEDAPGRALLRGDAPLSERGPSDFDVRHTVNGLLTYDLHTPFDGGVLRALTRKWTFDALFNARSARPVNVVYAFPVEYGFAFLRPDLVGGAPLYVTDESAPGGRRLNAAAFALPGALRQGTLGRNALRAFPFSQFDLALARGFNFTERVRLELRAEAFNLFNHPNFDDPVANLADLGGMPNASSTSRFEPYFGRALSARGGETWEGQAGGFGPLYSMGGPRTVQLSLKLTF
jgi:hypothetical protein